MEAPPDTEVFYSPAAQSLLDGAGYRVDGKFSDRYPPLYPVFLAGVYAATGAHGTGNTVYPVIIAFLQALNCGWIFLIARRMLCPEKIAAAFFATCPFFAALSMTGYAWTAMPLFLFLFFAAVFFLLKAADGRRKQFFSAASGSALGLSCLAWPAPVYIWVVFTAYLALKKAGKRAGAVFILAFFLPILMWSSIVWKNTGHFRVSGGQWPSVRDGLTHAESPKFGAFEFVRKAREEMLSGRVNSPGQAASFIKERLAADFSGTLSFMAFKFFRPWYATDSEKHEGLILAVQLPYLLLAAAGLSGLWKKRKDEVFLFLGIVCYFWLAAFAVLPILRYMMPAMGVLMIFSAAGAARFSARKAAS